MRIAGTVKTNNVAVCLSVVHSVILSLFVPK